MFSVYLAKCKIIRERIEPVLTTAEKRLSAHMTGLLTLDGSAMIYYAPSLNLYRISFLNQKAYIGDNPTVIDFDRDSMSNFIVEHLIPVSEIVP